MRARSCIWSVTGDGRPRDLRLVLVILLMASKSNGLEASDWARGPPPSGPLWERIAKAIYDPKEKSFLGRTPKRWGIVITFYLVFYAVLAVMFSICMAVLLLNLDNRIPKYQQQDSLIGAQPGLDYRPRASDEKTVALIANGTDGFKYYTKELDEFFEHYKNQYADKKECTAADNYGFPETPCFFVKLNRIYGWKPETLDPTALPGDMLPDLTEFITKLRPEESNQVWVSCWDEAAASANATSVDSANATRIEYPWERGFHKRFYPFLNSNGYLSPLVAVKVHMPADIESVVIRCRAWAKNIVYNKSLKEPAGYTRIVLKLVRSTTPTTK